MPPARRWPSGAAPAEHCRFALAQHCLCFSVAQGFIQFRLSGERIHLDVEALNEQLKSNGAARMRHAMCPDEAL